MDSSISVHKVVDRPLFLCHYNRSKQTKEKQGHTTRIGVVRKVFSSPVYHHLGLIFHLVGCDNSMNITTPLSPPWNWWGGDMSVCLDDDGEPNQSILLKRGGGASTSCNDYYQFVTRKWCHSITSSPLTMSGFIDQTSMGSRDDTQVNWFRSRWVQHEVDVTPRNCPPGVCPLEGDICC